MADDEDANVKRHLFQGILKLNFFLNYYVSYFVLVCAIKPEIEYQYIEPITRPPHSTDRLHH